MTYLVQKNLKPIKLNAGNYKAVSNHVTRTFYGFVTNENFDNYFEDEANIFFYDITPKEIENLYFGTDEMFDKFLIDMYSDRGSFKILD